MTHFGFGCVPPQEQKILSNRCLNYTATILDEIALEGLDGITLQGLWVRLQACPNFSMLIDPYSQRFVWEIVKRLEDVAMFELPSERPPLIIFNRFESIDPELGNVIEPDVIPEDIYPHKLVDDQEKGICGSCATYEARKEITHEVRLTTLEEATQSWGGRLVLVASQSVRSAALMGDDVDPTLDLNAMHYCILERIGRSRYLGEVTQGKMSLQCTGEEPKSLFYYRKTLQLHKLVTKQVFNLKSNNQHTCSGSLLHLPRFYSEHKPKAYYLTEKVVELLKKKTNYLAEYDEIRSQLGLANALKKLFKTPDFQRFVKTDLKVPFRTVYPDASKQQWKQKGSDKERMLRVVQLISPHTSVREEWTKEEEVEEEEEGNGYLDESSRLLDQPLMTQAFNVVDKAGPNGVTQMELAKLLGQTKLQARTLCRNLLRKGLVSTFMNDVGRQRVCRYCSKRFDQSGHLSQQFHKERDKMLSLVSSKKNTQVTDDCSPAKQGNTLGESNDTTTAPAESDTCPGPSSLVFVKVEQPDIFESECDDYASEKESSYGPDSSSVADESSDLSCSFLESPNRVNTGSVKKTAQEKLASKGLPRKKKKKSAVKPNVVWRREPQSSEDQGTTTEVLVAEDVALDGTSMVNSSFTEDLKDMYSKQKKDPPSITTRVLKRANLIMEAVQQHKVIDDVVKLLKLIHEKEEEEGINTKIDKKSLLRLLEKLGKDGIIKNIRVVLKNATKEKNLMFVCEPNITIEHSLIQSTLEQAKMKLCSMSIWQDNSSVSDVSQDTTFDTASVHNSIAEIQKLNGKPFESKPLKRFSRYGKQYGYQPKFVRMKIMHQLLFYLIYEYRGSADLDQETTINTFKNVTSITDEEALEMPHIYSPTVDWRMFVPPLPTHEGWPNGWAIMCDILLRLPLSIFVNLVNITYDIVGLNEYLAHPIRKHYLLKHLPTGLCSQLTAARRYIYNCHEIVSRLCYIGLVQFGPQRLKEKDQVFIFLNKNASLLDTTPSPAGYHQVATDMEYQVQRYHFQTSQDVDLYWYKMWNICVKTNLGGRMCVSGKDILLEILENKPAMISAIHPRKPENAPLGDKGEIPGDHCGAAGLDSALFAHLKRNWHWSNLQVGSATTNDHALVINDSNPSKENNNRPCKETPVRKASKRLASSKKETLSPKQFTPKKTVGCPASASSNVTTPIKRRSTRQDKIRTVPARKASRKRPYYDEADMEALALMSKLRVEWTTPEDNLLLLCKVAATYLCPNHRQQSVSMQAWRNLLHKNIPSSRNKTSRAIQRRILYMMRNASTSRSVSLCLQEIEQDPEISQQFSNLRNHLKTQSENAAELEKKMGEKFVELVTILQDRYQNMQSQSGPVRSLILPDTIEEFHEKFSLSVPRQIRIKGRFHVPANIGDIHAAVLNAMIYSSLCCQNDKTSFAFQLFKVYQQYPDSLLRSTVSKIRADQMVSLRKSYSRTKLKSGNILPVSSSPFQLSISYLHLLQNRYQYEIFHECFTMLQRLVWDMLLNTDVNGVELFACDGGSTAAFIEFLIMDKISFQITVPDQLIILDPRISQKDETYARILARYQDVLRKCNVSREMTNSSELCEQPFMDTSQRNKDWDNEGETDGESGPSCSKKRKIDNSSKSQSSSTDTQTSSNLSKPSENNSSSSDSEDDIETQKAIQHTHQHAVARAASRIALYMMRGDTEEPNVTKVQEAQHAHDFFVVNSCKVVCRLREILSKDSTVETVIGIDPHGNRVKCPVVQTLLPVTAKDTAQIFEDISRNTIFTGPDSSEEDALLALKNKGLDSRFLKSILGFIFSKKEMGASYADLKSNFSVPKSVIKQATDELTASQLLLRAGVTTVVFVHHKKTRPWLIHSRKLVRLDREKLKPSESKAVDLSSPEDMEAENTTDAAISIDAEMQEVEDIESETEVEKACEGSLAEESADCDEQGPSNSCQKVLDLKTVRTKRGTARLRAGSPSSFKDIDSLPSELIRVAIRPWIRVDGSINRRVLDRLLGSVLGHCLSSPGCSLEKIGERFSPALQPVHSRELCEILLKLGCIQWKVLESSHLVTLFSKARSIEISDASGTEKEADIMIEPLQDAILRLGLFIGDKAYSKDFLSNSKET